jgi:hypothetical protein
MRGFRKSNLDYEKFVGCVSKWVIIILMILIVPLFTTGPQPWWGTTVTLSMETVVGGWAWYPTLGHFYPSTKAV